MGCNTPNDDDDKESCTKTYTKSCIEFFFDTRYAVNYSFNCWPNLRLELIAMRIVYIDLKL